MNYPEIGGEDVDPFLAALYAVEGADDLSAQIEFAHYEKEQAYANACLIAAKSAWDEHDYGDGPIREPRVVFVHQIAYKAGKNWSMLTVQMSPEFIDPEDQRDGVVEVTIQSVVQESGLLVAFRYPDFNGQRTPDRMQTLEAAQRLLEMVRSPQ